MSKTDELKKLAQKITGETPSGRRASNVVEFIADKISGDTENTNTISESISYLADVYEPTPPAELQEKEVTITENGTTTVEADEGYDGLSSVDITTNVPSVEIHDWSYMFQNSRRLEDLDQFINMKPTSMGYCFNNANATQIDLPAFDTSNCTSFGECFSYTGFKSYPHHFDTSSATYLSNMCRGNSLTNEAARTFIANSLLTVPTSYNSKTLSHLGYSQTVSNQFVNMPQWEQLSANGWTTGY